MTDNVCHSILKTATQQIIQSAGFEAANHSSMETLTDVFAKYMELLADSVTSFANLNGRTMGNSYDVIQALDEMALEPKNLKSWLEEEGKALAPCWTAQSDPGRLIQGIVRGGRPSYEDMIEYQFGDNIFEYEYDDLDTVESPSPTIETHNLPAHIPNYLPPFPELKTDEDTEMGIQKEQELLKQKKEKEDREKNNDLRLPLLVKNRKKPVDNPFIHIIPFEDSSLNVKENNEENIQPQPLSSLLLASNEHTVKKRALTEEEEQEMILKKRKLTISSLMEALTNIKNKEINYKVGEGITNQEELFKLQTENSATPGNYLFNHDLGVFDQVVRSVADPLIISKLTTPNLQTDLAFVSTAANTPNNEFFRASPTPTSPHENGLVRSSSMLAALAHGQAQAKKKSAVPTSLSAMSSQTLSKHSVDINAIKTGDSKYIIKKKRMLAEKQLQLERQAQMEKEGLSISSDGNSSVAGPSNSTTTNLNNITPSTTTINNNMGSSTSIPSSSSSRLGFTSLPTPTKPAGPISLSSFSSSLGNNNVPPTSFAAAPKPEKEKKKHKAKAPKLTLNLPTASFDTDVSSSPNTPKIRFKIKAPSATSTPTTTVPPPIVVKLERPQLTALPPAVSQPTDEIRCICENPTVDYGTFMIACDRCGVWYHGSCVGIAESDQVEEWFCRRCSR